MKKIIFIFLILFSLSEVVFAKTPFTEFKVGYLDPRDTKAGYIFGINVGRMIDESLSWSFELNYFQKNYKKITDVAVSQNGLNRYSTKELRVELTSRIVPLFLKLNYEHSVRPGSPLYARASGGVGWEFVWNKENNYDTNQFKNRFFNGFGWQLSGGLGFEISSSANLFIDAFYNESKVKRNKKTNSLGYPTWEELDISGLGVRLGISIVGFGWL